MVLQSRIGGSGRFAALIASSRFRNRRRFLDESLESRVDGCLGFEGGATPFESVKVNWKANQLPSLRF